MKTPAPTRLTLGQLGKRAGLARSSVLHYEALGLLIPAGRTAAGYRIYGARELERLLAIRRLRDAGLSLADVRALVDSPTGANHSGPAALLEKRLLELSQAVEGIREQQRLLARLLAAPGIRTRGKRWNKDAWVALLRQAGFDDAAMKQWHAEFERENPSGHAVFLASLGIKPAQIAAIRRSSKLAP
jgi:MerR family transcriptional regulator, thiopeptide resistance regulator